MIYEKGIASGNGSYVDPEQSGKGIALALLEELVAVSEIEGIWATGRYISREHG